MALGLGTLLLCLAGGLRAQAPAAADTTRPNPREGFWVSIGLGNGTGAADCPDCAPDHITSLSEYIRLGGTLSQSFLFGVEENGYYPQEGQVREMGFVSGVVIWYPRPTGAWFVKVGAGIARYHEVNGGSEIQTWAPQASIGAGYDFRTSRVFSITAFVTALATGTTGYELDGVATSSRISFRLVQVGVGLTWH